MSVNPKSLRNLRPYQKGVYSPTRQVGRKKGSINRKTLVKQLMESKLDPEQLFSVNAREIGKKAKGKTVYEAILMALVNGALNLDVKSANTLLRLIDKIDTEEESKSTWDRRNKIEITIINPEDLDDLERF